MKSIFYFLTAIAFGLISSSAWSQHPDHSENATPYAGLQSRQIKSLSDQDIREISLGQGWGLALPAELNGLPGPKHVLELRESLGLSSTQIGQVETIYSAMKEDAIAAGQRFIAAEAALSRAFGTGTIDKPRLRELLSEASSARAQLRFVHLSRHIETAKLLTQAQIEQYAVLRGYASDPCADVPDGHDPDMWRKHNGCN